MNVTDRMPGEKSVLPAGAEPNNLLVIWTSGDRDVALKMVLMYTRNAKVQGWWENVSLLIWGPSQKLVLEDEEVCEQVEAMGQAGIRLLACVQCAKEYGIVEPLKEHGVEVFGMGPLLTNWLKSDARVVTF